MRTSSGFTLIELLITVVVLAIALGIAVPSMQQFLINSRAETIAATLNTAINQARTEAVKRGARVSICSSTNGTSCDTNGWAAGWIVVTDNAASDTTTSVTVGTVLSRGNALPSGAVVAAGAPAFIRFSALGTAPVRGNFSTKTTGCTGTAARTINISASGRIAIAKASC